MDIEEGSPDKPVFFQKYSVYIITLAIFLIFIFYNYPSTGLVWLIIVSSSLLVLLWKGVPRLITSVGGTDLSSAISELAPMYVLILQSFPIIFFVLIHVGLQRENSSLWFYILAALILIFMSYKSWAGKLNLYTNLLLWMPGVVIGLFLILYWRLSPDGSNWDPFLVLPDEVTTSNFSQDQPAGDSQNSNSSLMNCKSADGKIPALSSGLPSKLNQHYYYLCNFYIMSSYKTYLVSTKQGDLSGGLPRLSQIASILQYGVRAIHLDIFTQSGTLDPIVYHGNNYVNYCYKGKYLTFEDCCDTIVKNAFNSSLSNYQDPLFLVLEIHTSNIDTLNKIANLIRKYMLRFLLGTSFSYERTGDFQSLGKTPVTKMIGTTIGTPGRVVILAGPRSKAIRNSQFWELVNWTWSYNVPFAQNPAKFNSARNWATLKNLTRPSPKDADLDVDTEETYADVSQSGRYILTSRQSLGLVWPCFYPLYSDCKDQTVYDKDLKWAKNNDPSIPFSLGTQFNFLMFSKEDKNLKSYLKKFGSKRIIFKPKNLRYVQYTYTKPKPPNPALKYNVQQAKDVPFYPGLKL